MKLWKMVEYMGARWRDLSKEAGIYLLFFFAGIASVLMLPWVTVSYEDAGALLGGYVEIDIKAQFAVSSVVPFDLVLAGLMTFGLLGVLADGRGDTRVVHAGITAAVCGWVASIAGFFIVIYIGDALASSSTDGPVQEPGVGLFLVFVCSLAAMATALRCCFGKPSGMTVWDAAEPGRSRKKGNENEVQEVR